MEEREGMKAREIKNGRDRWGEGINNGTASRFVLELKCSRFRPLVKLKQR